MDALGKRVFTCWSEGCLWPFLPMVGRVFSLFGKLFGFPRLDSFGSHFMEQGGDVFLLRYL